MGMGGGVILLEFPVISDLFFFSFFWVGDLVYFDTLTLSR